MAYLRLLFWLKWKLLWRGYRRSMSAAFGVILALIFFLPLALGIAAGCAIGFRALAPPDNEHLLRGVLLGIYLFWLLTPLLGYALSDSYDITKLLHFPLSARQIFTGAILGSLIDFPVLLLLPTLLAVLIGFNQGALTLVLLVPAVALFLFHTLSLSQAIMLASAGVLRSRRFRDLATVLIPLFWMSYFVLSHSVAPEWIRVHWSGFLQSRTWELLNYLPPGLAARSIAAASRGEYPLSLGFLLALLACSAGTIYLAGWLIEKLYAGEVISPAVRKAAASSPARVKTPSPESTAASARTAAFLKLPPVIEAMADKEVKYLFRDPYFKIVLMNLVYVMFIGVFMLIGRQGIANSEGPRPAVLWGATGFMLLSETRLMFNSFGTEGASAAMLFLFPSSRRQILIGKNLTLFAALSLVNLVCMTVLATVGGALEMFGPLFCWMELATLVCIAVGNLTSIWLPARIVLRGWRIGQQSASRGSAYGFLYLALAAVAGVLLLPVLAALLAPTFWVSPVWYTLGIPLAAAYAAGLYALSLRLAEPLLLQREQILIQRLGQEE